MKDDELAWDGYDAYLFDIDGTLLHCTDAVHYFAFCEALSGVAGRPLNLDGVVAHGNVDTGILRDAWRLAGVPESVWRPGLRATQEGMCRFVTERVDDLRITVLPGVREVLAHLRARGAVVGVATGNLEGIGRVKLGRAGLLECFDFGGYSDGFEYRAEVFGAALGLARGMAGKGARVCVVGDTPEDVRAARANGMDVTAVATGIYSMDELVAAGATRCVRGLGELVMGDGEAAKREHTQIPFGNDSKKDNGKSRRRFPSGMTARGATTTTTTTAKATAGSLRE